MPNPSRQKGNRAEREIVELHRDIGVAAERVPLSGAAGGSFTGDIRIGVGLTAEVKARGRGEGFATLTRWLGDNDLLFLRMDRQQPMVAMPWETYVRLLKGEVAR